MHFKQCIYWTILVSQLLYVFPNLYVDICVDYMCVHSLFPEQVDDTKNKFLLLYLHLLQNRMIN